MPCSCSKMVYSCSNLWVQQWYNWRLRKIVSSSSWRAWNLPLLPMPRTAPTFVHQDKSQIKTADRTFSWFELAVTSLLSYYVLCLKEKIFSTELILRKFFNISLMMNYLHKTWCIASWFSICLLSFSPTVSTFSCHKWEPIWTSRVRTLISLLFFLCILHRAFYMQITLIFA